MAYEQKDMSGALFRNDKGDNAKRPDYRGDAKIDGVTYELSAWIKEGQKGKWMSISFKSKDEAPKPKGRKPDIGKDYEPPDEDSVPF